MDNQNLKYLTTPFSFLLLLLLLFSFATSTVSETTTSSHVTLNPFAGIDCSIIDCGQGTCQPSTNSLLGFECICKPGWKKIQTGPFTFPYCLIPNCTIDFQCGKGSPSPPPPPASLHPPANRTNHCDFVWCGDGECESNGTGHICHCPQGSENLFNSSALPCFKPCYFGADCQTLNIPFGNPTQQPPPPPASSNSPASYDNGLKGVSSCSGTLCGLTVIMVIAACLTWF
ncbi:hypothetical protein HRI_002854500 [Hibiscus trionum]|uniref:EGF-like domain-containing protein n=1 Tax=Hibiscus trionum TaxID=183268 RepID=A0A9W7IAR7_HIBTR|nr:hypothetical protein HRI_002854500 [Hibiscus trionum]